MNIEDSWLVLNESGIPTEVHWYQNKKHYFAYIEPIVVKKKKTDRLPKYAISKTRRQYSKNMGRKP